MLFVKIIFVTGIYLFYCFPAQQMTQVRLLVGLVDPLVVDPPTAACPDAFSRCSFNFAKFSVF